MPPIHSHRRFLCTLATAESGTDEPIIFRMTADPDPRHDIPTEPSKCTVVIAHAHRVVTGPALQSPEAWRRVLWIGTSGGKRCQNRGVASEITFSAATHAGDLAPTRCRLLRTGRPICHSWNLDPFVHPIGSAQAQGTIRRCGGILPAANC